MILEETFLSNREEFSGNTAWYSFFLLLKTRENNAFFSHNIIHRSHSLAREVTFLYKINRLFILEGFQNFLLQEFVS